MTPETQKLFRNQVPSHTDELVVESWADALVPQITTIKYSGLPRDRFDSITINDMENEDDVKRFINMVLLSDWACYAPPQYSIADRCLFERMNRVVRSYDKGFRLIVCQLDDGKIVPVGYTGWYPISEEVFTILESEPQNLDDRGRIQYHPIKETNDVYCYLFNYSVVQTLRHTWVSKFLLESLKSDVTPYAKRGISCVAVSEDGKRIAHRYGMPCTGLMTHMGESEDVFALRFDPPAREIKLRPKQTQEPALLKSGSSKA